MENIESMIKSTNAETPKTKDKGHPSLAIQV